MGKKKGAAIFVLGGGRPDLSQAPGGNAPQLAGASERPGTRQSRLDRELSRAFLQGSCRLDVRWNFPQGDTGNCCWCASAFPWNFLYPYHFLPYCCRRGPWQELHDPRMIA